MSTGWKPAEALHGAQLHIAHGGVDARSPEESLTIKWGYTSLRGGVPHRAIQDGVEWEAVLGAGGDRLRISVDFKRTAWAQACVVLPSLAVPVGRRNGVLAPLRMGRLIRPAGHVPSSGVNSVPASRRAITRDGLSIAPPIAVFRLRNDTACSSTPG